MQIFNRGLSAGIFILCMPLLFLACASTPGGRPDWVRDPYRRYDSQLYLAAVGSGNSRDLAERNALANLTAIFGQSIIVDERISTSYREAVQSGAAAGWSEVTAIETDIAIYASMDTLAGVEIGETWHDGRNEYFAVAVMNKSRAAMIYSGMIMSNLAMINNLVDIPQAEKNTIEGYARFQLAALIADMTESYESVLSVIGIPARGMERGSHYRLEAVNIARLIPISLRVQNDMAGRIEGAFTGALSSLGFRTGSDNPLYVLDVNIITNPVQVTNSPYMWTRIEVAANLADSRGAVLMPYNFNERTGQLSQSEADNRAYTLAERRINQEYADTLNNYLSRLLPIR